MNSWGVSSATDICVGPSCGNCTSGHCWSENLEHCQLLMDSKHTMYIGTAIIIINVPILGPTKLLSVSGPAFLHKLTRPPGFYFKFYASQRDIFSSS